ncbi:hypothetical protein MTR67_003266 [Solanum verrucosum]|uniref:Uncharacterized protein n=1 Tax=Solanum verrucosum TaxID=315347 RepID=A0AAF0PWI9_SOLVR|nr:hypothetical protein MTR67_003266 [Solanum verrucosum]
MGRSRIDGQSPGESDVHRPDELQGMNLDDFDLNVDEFLGVDFGSFDSDVDQFEYMNKRMQDISDAEVRKGNDIEGIPWEKATITRVFVFFLLIVIGFLVDSGNGKAISPLCAHVNYSFASAWHRDGLTFATRNQDKTCSIWDIRNLSKLVTTFKGNLVLTHNF